MHTFYSTITELKTVKAQKARLAEKEAELSAPLLADTSLIPRLYTHFKEILRDRDTGLRAGSPVQRRKFIFLILCFYAPVVLAGGRMPKGLRDVIAGVTNADPTFVSHSISDVIFQFQNYKDFQTEIYELYARFEEYLREKGLISPVSSHSAKCDERTSKNLEKYII